MIKKSVRDKATEYLLKVKESHYKTSKLDNSDLRLQEYLKPIKEKHSNRWMWSIFPIIRFYSSSKESH